jgi:hypothetical protein
VAGGHVEILPEEAHSESYANRYRVLTSPLLTRHDCALIESILLADIAMAVTHDEAKQAVLQTLGNLAEHDPADWINQEVEVQHDQPRCIQDIVRRLLEVTGGVKKIQLEVLNCLAKANSLDEVINFLSEAANLVCQAKQDLRNGLVPLEELVVTQSLSRAVEGYTSPSPAARAALQLQAIGNEIAPGQFMRFIFVRGEERVRVWELGIDARMVDVKRYCALLDRAVSGVVCMFEKEELGLGI